MSLLKNILVFFVILLCICSCQIYSPDLNQQKYMVENGTFVGGVPDWVYSDDASLESQRLSKIKQAMPTRLTTRDNPYSDSYIDPNNKSIFYNPFLPQSKKTESVLDADIDREQELSEDQINDIDARDQCPHIESRIYIIKKLRDPLERIGRYNALLSQCSTSPVLYLLLGGEYQKSNQPAEALKAYNRALELDPTNKSAVHGINKIVDGK